MQQVNSSSKLNKALGEIIREVRSSKYSSARQFAFEYDIDNGNLNRIENGVIDSKISTLWKISEALGVKLSVLIGMLEDKLGNSFRMIDE